MSASVTAYLEEWLPTTEPGLSAGFLFSGEAVRGGEFCRRCDLPFLLHF